MNNHNQANGYGRQFLFLNCMFSYFEIINILILKKFNHFKTDNTSINILILIDTLNIIDEEDLVLKGGQNS